jgi:uncharacterized protein
MCWSGLLPTVKLFRRVYRRDHADIQVYGLLSPSIRGSFAPKARSAVVQRLGTIALLVTTLACLLATIQTATATRRLALVIGNGAYQTVPPLLNPPNDAQDLADSLRHLGFDVIEQRDATRDALVKAVHDFSDRLPAADIALFFYAGHGLQLNGENYLIPVDAKIQNPADVRFNTINLTDVQQEMEGGNRTTIIILDACRDNPFADKLAQSGRSIATRGLVRMDATAAGSLIVYSTQPNNIALDGAGRNSPFTAALLNHVATPGLEVRQMISRVRADVLAATDKKQTPWDSSSLVGDVYLAGSAPDPAPQTTTLPAPAVAPAAQPTPRDASASSAGSESECDKIAALHLPHTSPAAVQETEQPNWSRGVIACQMEVQSHPDQLRFVYELARSQDHVKDYIEALRNYKTVTAGGFSEALVDLGAMYYLGHGVIQNYSIAFDYFSKAAAAGSPRGLANMAAMYADGRGVPKDDAKSLDYAEKSVAAGNPFGLKVIADHYFNGAGVPRDYQMAARYYQQAADLGDGQSIKFLANMYENGYLGLPDAAKAAELRLRAQEIDPGSPDPSPLSMLQKASAATTPQNTSIAHRRPYVVYHYNPVWQAAPGDTSCCPNNMLVCPLGRHFCGR